MAEGGELRDEHFELIMEDIQPRGDDDDDQEVDTTRPFQPGAASTPYHEMQTMMHEHSGLPSYDETTPLVNPAGGEIPTVEDLQKMLDKIRYDRDTGLLDTTKLPDASVNPLSEEDKQLQINKVKDFIKARYPNANVHKLVIKFSTKKPMDIVVLGPRGGEKKIVLDEDSGLRKDFLNQTFVKKVLGESFEE